MGASLCLWQWKRRHGLCAEQHIKRPAVMQPTVDPPSCFANAPNEDYGATNRGLQLFGDRPRAIGNRLKVLQQ